MTINLLFEINSPTIKPQVGSKKGVYIGIVVPSQTQNNSLTITKGITTIIPKQ